METLLAGVDFSGAREVPNETWIAVGKLGSLGLEIMDVRRVGSHALAKELATNQALVAVGIDCPFSLPANFLNWMAAKSLRKDYQSWQEVAEQLVFMSFEEFHELVKEFKKDSKRFTDTALKVPAISPLHRGNPSMVQMTYHGIRFLATLDPKRFFVQPFQDPIPFGCAVLEMYPRDTLNYFQLPEQGYKSKDKKELDKVQLVRRQIMGGLTSVRERKGLTYQHCPRLSIPKKVEHLMLESDHALDAVTACYTTGFYVAARERFNDPLSSDNLDVLLEGWIYAPQR